MASNRQDERKALGADPEIAGANAQAASVCLDRHHSPPQVFVLDDNGDDKQAQIEWQPPDSRIRGAWANSTDTTEAGAYACALAGTELLRGFVAVRRAETGSGVDYYIGPPGAGTEDLEECLRLEVSGADHEGLSSLKRRLEIKINQAREGRSSLPAIACVVGFLAKRILMVDVVEER